MGKVLSLPLSEDIRASRIRGRRTRNAVRWTHAARDELAAHLVQILPAMWIWLPMFDLKAHVLDDKSFHVLRGPVPIPAGPLIIAITVASFYFNAVFAFAVSRSGRPRGPAGRRAGTATPEADHALGRRRRRAACVLDDRRNPMGTLWFTISRGIVVGVMMVSYVAVPSRLIGAKPPKQPRRDKLAGTAVGGALSANVCTPPPRSGASASSCSDRAP